MWPMSPTALFGATRSERRGAFAALRRGFVTQAILAAATGGTVAEVMKLEQELQAHIESTPSISPLQHFEI